MPACDSYVGDRNPSAVTSLSGVPLQRGLSRLSAYVSGQLLVKALYLGGIVLATRAAGPEQWGVLSGALALGIIGVTLVNLGLSPLVSRELAAGRVPAHRLLAAAVRFRLIASVVYLIAVPGALLVSIRSLDASVALALTLYLLLDSWTQFQYAVMRGLEVIRYEIVGTICEKLFFLATAFVAFQASPDQRLALIAAGFCLAAAVNLAIAAAGALTVLPKASAPWRFVASTLSRPRFLRREFRYVRESAPFLFAALFTTIYFRVDAFMVATMVGAREAGWYSAAYRIIEGLMFVPQSMLVVFAPALVRALQQRSRDSLAIVRQLAAVQALVVIPIAIGLALEADWLIQTLYGDSYESSSALLFLLAPGFVAIGANFLLGGLLTATYRQKRLLTITAAGALFNIVLNAFLLPGYGAQGAIVATILTEALVAGAMLREVHRELGSLAPLAPFAKAAVMCSALILTPSLVARALEVPTAARLGIEIGAMVLGTSFLLYRLALRLPPIAPAASSDSNLLADHAA